VQASDALVVSFGLLAPAAALHLVGSLVYVGRGVGPAVAGSRRTRG
jgi:hypothetical protein